jgi:dTDP-3-amino-3,4,6-trideoxy-alpha-D-glucose transaminase
MTAVPTATGVIQSGARPILADVDAETCLLDVASVERVLTPRTRAIVAVHLYGQCCRMGPLRALADRAGLRLLEDAAQAHGALDQSEPVGSRSDAACFSFYPSKNLGALGDAGAIVTNSRELADRCRRIRNYGQRDRYEHVEYGINSRLDELQAAILSAKLPELRRWNDRRRWIASRYDAALANSPDSPVRNDQGADHVYHLYVVKCRRRVEFADVLRSHGVETGVHYPRCLAAHDGLPPAVGEWAVAGQLADSILTVPLFPELTDDEVSRVARALEATRRAAQR